MSIAKTRMTFLAAIMLVESLATRLYACVVNRKHTRAAQNSPFFLLKSPNLKPTGGVEQSIFYALLEYSFLYAGKYFGSSTICIFLMRAVFHDPP